MNISGFDEMICKMSFVCLNMYWKRDSCPPPIVDLFPSDTCGESKPEKNYFRHANGTFQLSDFVGAPVSLDNPS